ncbi:MAG TPA: carboxypeptidase-like regulatory domain-containing protein, partial [Bacteroidota bacterium]|nr:carboxypeptidase-like regulatory domain-containing protein [Bacteroidota bacterium]
NFKLEDTTTKKPFEILTLQATYNKPSSVTMITARQDSNAAYRLFVHNITDTVGNIINPIANTLAFSGSPKHDTLGFRLLSVPLKDSTRGVAVQPTLMLEFSDALSDTIALDSIILLSAKNDTVEVEKQILNDAVIAVRPKEKLKNMSWYALKAALRTIRSWNNVVCRDSTKRWRFETLDIEDLSSIEGRVFDQNEDDLAGTVYVTALMVGGKDKPSYTVPADTSGHFFIPEIQDGKYVLQAFRDRNKNGKFDAGRPFPFIRSERISGISDTLKVRARWPLEDARLNMR